MLVSTKGRYALRVMVDLAQNGGAQYLPLKEIAARQEISEKYLESILAMLGKSGLVQAMRGKGGGYRLVKEPAAYTVSEILNCADGSLAPVACLAQNAEECPRKIQCQTLPVWVGLNNVIVRYLHSITLQQVADGTVPQHEI